MSQTTEWLALLMRRELEGFERELALFPDEALVWQTAPGVTNSAGTLALHICGNLQWFIGGVLGGTGYIRDRDWEFSARNVSRDALLAEVRRAIEVVRTVLPHVSDDQLAQPYPETVGGVTMITGAFVTHLAAHAAFHLGQAGYLRRVLTGDSTSAGPVPLAPLAMPAADR
jgi:uncharacterized damage-inducible protein DinB